MYREYVEKLYSQISETKEKIKQIKQMTKTEILRAFKVEKTGLRKEALKELLISTKEQELKKLIGDLTEEFKWQIRDRLDDLKMLDSDGATRLEKYESYYSFLTFVTMHYHGFASTELLEAIGKVIERLLSDSHIKPIKIKEEFERLHSDVTILLCRAVTIKQVCEQMGLTLPQADYKKTIDKLVYYSGRFDTCHLAKLTIDSALDGAYGDLQRVGEDQEIYYYSKEDYIKLFERGYKRYHVEEPRSIFDSLYYFRPTRKPCESLRELYDTTEKEKE